MSQRTVPDRQRAAEARFNQLQVERFTPDVQLAIGHSNGRNSRVATTLEYLSLVRSTGVNLGHINVAIEAAVRQLFRSHEGHQAAHYLPGQIYVNRELPSHFVSDLQTRRNIDCLFAEVENLPGNFNKADSAAESKGLAESFRKSCESVLREGALSGKNRINRELVRNVYSNLWTPNAIKSYFDAIAQKQTMPGIPELTYDSDGNIANLEERSTAPETAWNFDEQIRILNRYAEAMRTPPAELQTGKMEELERTFKP